MKPDRFDYDNGMVALAQFKLTNPTFDNRGVYTLNSKEDEICKAIRVLDYTAGMWVCKEKTHYTQATFNAALTLIRNEAGFAEYAGVAKTETEIENSIGVLKVLKPGTVIYWIEMYGTWEKIPSKNIYAAKIYASKNGASLIGISADLQSPIDRIARKNGGKWLDIREMTQSQGDRT
jgi:hypothetical protein